MMSFRDSGESGMTMRKNFRLSVAALVAVCLLPALIHAQRGGKSFVFRGRVVSVNAGAGTLSVANENIEGWMAPMTMTYKADKPEELKPVKAGDTITATVYAGDFNTLYNVKVVTSATADDLPPIQYVCPTPAEASYFDEKPGKCPKSGEALVPARLVTAYSCLKNQVFIREAPGVCPMDRSELVPITVNMYFTCENDPKVREMNPGKCADGSARKKAFDRRPHGDHNPRHGGDGVFMSSDQWHHLEGTFVSPGILRLYFYDDMSRPLSASALSGRVSLADDNATPIGPAIPLVLGSANHTTLEAKLPATKFPFNVKVYLKFSANDKEQAFDFTFKNYSKEP
jgi:hypothetical protein